MIRDVLELVRRELESYVDGQYETPPEFEVVLDNIAFLEREDSDLSNRLVITLVNIEEERTLKNVPAHRVSPVNGSVEYKNPPVFLNLYLLFSANLTRYDESLRVLSYIIQFFQSRNNFTVANSPGAFPVEEGTERPELREYRLVFNIYTLTFEQLNHLWGALGGKQVPSVMYRVWMTELEDRRLIGSGELIEEIRSRDKLVQ